MYLSGFDFMTQVFPEYFSDKNNHQEIMDLKTKTLAEWGSVIKRTYELIVKYYNFTDLISYTISISDMKNINKNLDRLEVFLEKYSKATSML